MPASSTFQLGPLSIRDHVFSLDRSILAVTKGSSVDVYEVSSGLPRLITTLPDHDKPITSVDICPDGSGRILTCSQDRNAFVWQPRGDGTYSQTLVLLRISRAATVCKWSPNGSKFAVGLADRIVAVCYYEEENDWWISKHLKRPLRLTITSLLWHPNNVLLSCGLTDGHARVFSAYIKGLDAKPEPTCWGSKLPFQTLCGDYTTNTGSWIHAIGFSPSGNALAYVLHDAELHVVYADQEGQPPRAFYEITTQHLPFKLLVFILENKIVAAGHGGNIVEFEGDESGWVETRTIGNAEANPLGPKGTKFNGGGDDDDEISSHQALNMFKEMDLKGRIGKNSGSAAVAPPITILSMKAFSANEVSTSTIDGKVVVYRI